MGDVVLDSENIVEISVVAIRPLVMAGIGIDELSGDAHPIARFAHTALQHVPDTLFLTNLFHIDGLILIDHDRVSGDDG